MAEQNQPVSDLSPRMVSLGRALDRLPPGEYVIRLVKSDVQSAPWRAEIARSEPIRTMDLGKPAA